MSKPIKHKAKEVEQLHIAGYTYKEALDSICGSEAYREKTHVFYEVQKLKANNSY